MSLFKEIISDMFFNLKYIFKNKYKATIIAAIDSESKGMGFEGTMPWRISSDLKEFKKVTSPKDTTKNISVLVCGRVTFESIGRAALPGRSLIVLTKNPRVYFNTLYGYKMVNVTNGVILSYKEGSTKDFVIFAPSITKVYFIVRMLSYIEKKLANIFIIGGSKVYSNFLKYKFDGIDVNDCILTSINKNSVNIKSIFSGRYDTFFPMSEVDDHFYVKKHKVLEAGVVVKYYKRKIM